MHNAIRAFPLLLILLSVLTPRSADAQPVRLAADFGGEGAQIEVRDLRTDKAEVAIQAAFTEIAARLALAEAADGPRTQLHDATPGAPIDLDDHFAALLARSQQFCLWSNGAFGPLGGRLAEVRLAEESGIAVPPNRINEALTSARCDNMAVRVKAAVEGGPAAQSPTEAPNPQADLVAALAEGSRIDLRGWLRGFAVDAAAELLMSSGAGNFWIELGPVRRAQGAGPDGAGWPVILSFPGSESPIASIYLQDRAMAVTLPLQPPTDRDPLLVDQRTGQESSGIVAVAVVSELALDAEALATTTAIVGQGEGKMRMASLRPQPAAMVLLGDGSGRPIRADFRWLELPQIRQKKGVFP